MSVDIVAVDFEPITWAVRCDICDQIVTEPTTDGTLVDSQEAEHRQLHGLADVD